MASRKEQYTIRLGVEGGEIASATLSKVGKDGEKSLRRIESSGRGASKSLGDLSGLVVGRLIPALAGIASIREISQRADEMTTLTARIKLATEETGDFVKVYEELNRIAGDTGSGLAASVDVFQRLSLVRDDLGATNDQLLKVVETVQKLGVISGGSTAALEGALFQLGQLFSGTVVQAQEFNSLIDGMPFLVSLIADELGLSNGELIKMAKSGGLLVEDVFNAIINRADEANEKFEKMPVTLDRAFARLSVNFDRLINDINRTFEATDNLAGAINLFSAALEAGRFPQATLPENALASTYGGAPASQAAKDYLGGASAIDFSQIKDDRPEQDREELEKLFAQTSEYQSLVQSGLSGGDQTFFDIVGIKVKELSKEQKQLEKDTRKAEEAIQSVIEDLGFQTEQLLRSNKEQEVYNQLRRAGVDIDSEAGQEIKRLTENYYDLSEAQRKSEEEAERLKNAFAEMGATFSSAFEEAIIGGEKFSDVLQGLARDIQRIFLRKTVTDPLAGAIEGIIDGFDFGDLFGGIFGGARAGGGGVQQGVTYIVGERGPELFTAPSSGSITPNHAIKNMVSGVSQAPTQSSSVVLNQSVEIDARGADVNLEQRLRVALERNKQETIDELMVRISQGGQYARNVGRRA